MKKLLIFVLAVLLLAPMSINATESDETEETMKVESNDVTGTWEAMNSGLTNTHVYTLAIDPLTPSTIYAGTNGGVFKSTNEGGNWSASNLPYAVNILAINPSNPSILYASNNSNVPRLFKTTDGGSHWVDITPTDTPVCARYVLVIDPSDPGTFYTSNSYTAGIFQFTGGGPSRTYFGSLGFRVYALAVDPSSSSILYAGTDGNGVYKSTDRAANWSPMSDGLTNLNVYALAVNPANTSIIYAGTDGGIFKSTNGGANWNASGLANTHINVLAIDPSSPSFIYAGTNGGVFESTDGGANWSAINSGLTNTHVTSLAIDPLNSGILYAGTDGGGVFKSSPAEGPPSLHVSKSGTGNGTVTSTPSGIDCGSDCTETYNEGALVTLIAAPSSGSVFAGWSGACSGTGDCAVTMVNNKSVTATFNLQTQYSLTVVKAGTGDGTVTSSPTGISCGSNCSEAFQKVTKVKLTAKANPDSIFTGWSGGGYTGTKPCQVTVDSAITITASFDKKVPHISVSLNALDFGSVKMGKSLKKTLKIINNGTGDLSVSIGGVGGTDFSVSGSTSITVKPNKSYNLNVTFKPSSSGSKTATLILNSNDPSTQTVDIDLNGTGR